MSAIPLTDSEAAAAGDPLAVLYANVRQMIAQTLPGVVVAGILETDHSDMVSWENFTGEPRVVIAIEDTERAAEWYKTADVDMATVEIYYVSRVGGPLTPIRFNLRQVRRALNRWDRTKINMIEVVSMGWGKNIPANAILIEAGKKHRVGRLTFRVLVGESFDAGV